MDTAETIYFLSNSPEQDADGDGHNDVDAITSADGLRYALQEWLPTFKTERPSSLLLFMAGIEKGGRFQSRLDEEISAEQLQLWLSNAEAANSIDQSAIILEMNRAGAWIGTSIPATDVVASATSSIISGTISATISGRNRIS